MRGVECEVLGEVKKCDFGVWFRMPHGARHPPSGADARERSDAYL